ncbi:MAG TPA: hypothetical protein PK110_16340 [Niabella sp.]|nr:hypothetical protein [Niabella sp.]
MSAEDLINCSWILVQNNAIKELTLKPGSRAAANRQLGKSK